VSKPLVNWHLTAVFCSASSRSRFLACYRVQAPSGFAVTARDVHAARFDLQDKEYAKPAQHHRVDVDEVDGEHHAQVSVIRLAAVGAAGPVPYSSGVAAQIRLLPLDSRNTAVD
jgi:hypothetical protein